MNAHGIETVIGWLSGRAMSYNALESQALDASAEILKKHTAFLHV